jgi:PAS domain S-box-containing protein
VSELRRTEARLREQHSLLAGVLDNTADLIYVKDSRLRFTAVNRALVELNGVPGDALIGQEWTPRFPEARREEVRRLEEEVLATGETRTSEVTLNLEEPRTFLVTRTPYRDHEGRIVGLIGVGKDITDRLKAEETAERFHRQLRHSARMEAVGQLAGGVAHDFNNLLTAIFGSVEIALELTSPEDPRYDELGQIRRAGEHAAQLTRQLLAFGRLQVLEPRALDLNRLLRDLDRLLHRLIDASITFESVPRNDVGMIFADPSQIEQVVINLVVNARDAMPKGGRLLLETSNVVLDEAYARAHPDVKPGEYVMLSVSDTGTGIDPATMERLFEPFFTTKAPGSGTGLGLATVHGIVKQSGGHVWPYSEVGVGTTFKVYFPRLGAREAVPEAVSGRAASAPGGSETILVVEDNDVLAKVTVRLLQSAGYRVLLAPNPEAALQLCTQERRGIELVISDVVMPQFDGFELRDRLQALDPCLRVILTSGYSERRVRAEGVPDGTPFLPKPFTREELLRCVRASLDRAGTTPPA